MNPPRVGISREVLECPWKMPEREKVVLRCPGEMLVYSSSMLTCPAGSISDFKRCLYSLGRYLGAMEGASGRCLYSQGRLLLSPGTCLASPGSCQNAPWKRRLDQRTCAEVLLARLVVWGDCWLLQGDACVLHGEAWASLGCARVPNGDGGVNQGSALLRRMKRHKQSGCALYFPFRGGKRESFPAPLLRAPLLPSAFPAPSPPLRYQHLAQGSRCCSCCSRFSSAALLNTLC